MDIKVFSPEEFDKIEYAWKKLENGPDMTAFQLYDWYKNINALYFKEKTKNLFRKWLYILAEENGEPLMIAPLQVIKFSIGYTQIGVPPAFYMIGRLGYTDYLNFIYKEFSEQTAEAILKFVSNKYKMKSFIFDQILESTSLYKFIEGKYKTEKYVCPCASLTLPETFEEYKKILSKSTRQNIRTAINRQKRDGKNLTHELIYELDEETENTLMHIRAERLPLKKKHVYKNCSFAGKVYNHMRDVMVKLFAAEQNVIHENCNPWCFLVKEGERIAGFYWGITNDDKSEYYVILAGVEEDYAWYSPCVSHFYLYIEELYAAENNQIKVFDFTRGGESYKKDLGAEVKMSYRIDFKI